MLPLHTLLLLCQLAGEVVARLTGLPVPGPVLGLVLLFTGLAVRGRPAPALERAADTLLGHLSLLFVPAGVGVVQYLGTLADPWLAVTVALVGSAVAGIAATGLTLRVLTTTRRAPAGAGRGPA